MDNYIIYRKVLELEKNKESTLRIPIIFNLIQSEFIIEVPELTAQQNPAIELCFKDPSLSIANELISIKLHLNSTLIRFNPSTECDLPSKDLLFISVRSDSSFIVVISVRDLV